MSDVDFEIFIPIEPVAKGRPRLGKFGTFTPTKTKQAEAEIRYWLAKEGAKPFSGPLAVAMIFYMHKPKSLKKDAVWHTKRPDADNLAKQVMDAGNGFLWADDATICKLSVEKRYAPVMPGISVSILKIK